MGQILDRLGRLIKSELGAKDDLSFSPLSDENDDLLKAFEELKKSNSGSGSQSKQKSGNQPSSQMSESQACSILKVSPQASNEEIKAAYLKIIKEYHPDRVANLGDELKELAEKKTQEINSAYNFLKKLRGF